VVDIGWVVLAFFCGGYTGMLLLAVAAIFRQDPARSVRANPAPATAGGVPGSLDDDVDAALDQDVRLTATSSPM